MKVARLHGQGDVRLHDEPAPTPPPGEEIVRVTSVGICGSDLHWFAEGGIGDSGLESPLVLGHEFAGITSAGRRVAVDPAVPCLSCEFCLEGNPNLCDRMRFAGHTGQDGGMREQIAWPARCLFPLPDSLSDDDGAMLEPLGVALHAVDLGKVRSGDLVGVFGCGPIGLLVLQAARVAGAAEVLVTEPLAHRMSAARRLGAVPWTTGQRVDVAFECAGEAAAVDDAIQAVRPGGRVILAGIPADDRTSFPASVARRKGLTIKISRRMKHTYPRATMLVERGLIDVRSLVSHRFPLSRIPEAFAVAHSREGLKVVVDPTA